MSNKRFLRGHAKKVGRKTYANQIIVGSNCLEEMNRLAKDRLGWITAANQP